MGSTAARALILAQAPGASVPRHRLNMTETESARSKFIQSADHKSVKGQRQIQEWNLNAKCRFTELQTVSCLCMQWNQPDNSHTDYASKHDKAKLLYSHGPIIDSVVTDTVSTDTQTAFQTSEPGVHPDELPVPGNKRVSSGTSRMG